MITKEKLRELQHKKSSIFIKNFLWGNVCELSYYEYTVFEDCVFTNSQISIRFNDIYATREEAEFAVRNHDTEVIEFKPPFELKKGESYEFISKKYGRAKIYRVFKDYDCFEVVDERAEYGEWEEFTNYQEALDYAHKLFKGVEV